MKETVLANVICFGPMYNNLAPILNTRATVTEESAQHSLDGRGERIFRQGDDRHFQIRW